MSTIADLKIKYGSIVKLPIPINPERADSRTVTCYFRLPTLGEWVSYEKNKTNKLSLDGLLQKLVVHQEQYDVSLESILESSEMLSLNILNKLIPYTGFSDRDKLFEMYQESQNMMFTVHHQLMQFIISVLPIYKIGDLKQTDADELIEIATFAEALSKRPFYVEWIILGDEYAQSYMEANKIEDDGTFMYTYDMHINMKRQQLGMESQSVNDSKVFVDSETGRMIKGSQEDYRRAKQQKRAELMRLRNMKLQVPQDNENDYGSQEFAQQLNSGEEPTKEEVLTQAAAISAERTLKQQLEYEKELQLSGINKQKHYSWDKEIGE